MSSANENCHDKNARWDHAAFRRFGYEGLVYEGVSEEPIKVTGGSAAQSAFIYMYDEALGVKHDPEREAIIRRFQEYQCGDHREFVKAVSRGPSIRKFCEVMQNEALSEAYNCCLTALKDFRSYHIQVACRYITIQAHKNAKNNNENYPDQSNAGTGGTGFLPYLKSLRNNTSNSIIEKPDT
uniref:Indoleamine 2,3-dioxygenase 2-like n=1 Tax=Saccoglossus kowalevskii TaxID=10224 RepID=A0ABM0M3U0_SACKO|nr:PREDICTED: indoleamine 2,3-dioxygenase 2-like [Saccoglossus kowalevskii]